MAGAALLLDDDSTARYDYERRRPLRSLLAEQAAIPADRCLALIDVAIALISETYVHLPLKRALYAVDPESRLRLYRRAVDDEHFDRRNPVDARKFHTAMTSIFASLHDRHTRYWALSGLRDWDAFLPLWVEEYREAPAGPPRFVVSTVDAGVRALEALVGAEVTHWNGVPVEVAVRRLAETSGGANFEARRARGVDALTRRPLSTTPPPDEEWVDVTLRPHGGGKRFRRRFTWSAGYTPEARRNAARVAPDPEQADAVGLDDDADRVEQSKRVLVTLPVTTLAPFKPYADKGYACTVKLGDEAYGHLRLRSFDIGDDVPFVKAVAETLGLLQRLVVAGVIVDIRGNPGGSVIAAERLLQLFAAGPIAPEPLQLRTTRLALRLAADDIYRPWEPTLRQGVAAGGGYSAGFPCTSRPNAYNDIERVFDGPAILIVDALSYSASDFFAAGWQDNAAGRVSDDPNPVGRVLGTADRTGGGGATRLNYRTLRERLRDPPELPELGGEDPFTVAVRRSVRVGENNGVLVEDFGVTPDDVYRLTRDDVMGSNEGLLRRAAELLRD